MGTLIVTSEEDLRKIIAQVVREEVNLVIGHQRCGRTSSEETLLTRAEMAKFLRISLVTLTDWTHRGLPVHRKRKRGRVLFIKEEVVDWLRQNDHFKYKFE